LEHARPHAEERELERAARRWQILAEASRIVASSLDHVTALRAVARLAVPAVADYCIVDLLEGATFTRVAWAHPDPDGEALLAQTESHVALRGSAHPVEVACRERRPVFALLDEAGVERCAVSDDHRTLIRRLGARAIFCVPLEARGRTLGVMVFADCGNRLDSPHARELAEELAGRVAVAVDNARLFQQAQVAARRRDELLGIVSHDLRNPLNVIVMILAALRRDPMQSPERLQKRLDAMERSVDRMSGLIQDLLDVTKIEGSGLSLHREPIAIRALVEEAVSAARGQASGRSIALMCEVDERCPEAEVDGRRIRQVVSNLIANSLEHTDDGGSITVRATCEEPMLRVSVADTGKGIPEDELPQLFERFWQGQRSPTGGAGLGLAIARGIVEAHGGAIAVASRQGEGTTVTFTVPLSAAAPPSPAGPA
jgi:signal transduction histidine kinase